MMLEEQIDEIIDKQIVTRIDKRNDEKKIGRVLKQTETFLRDSEAVLREKLVEVDDLRAQVKQIVSERKALEIRRNKARAAYMQSED